MSAHLVEGAIVKENKVLKTLQMKLATVAKANCEHQLDPASTLILVLELGPFQLK